jgi:hypothetical protein
LRIIENLQIETCILHILDPQGQGLVLSDTLLPLGESPALMEYFTQHIRGSLQDPTLKAAKFLGTAAEAPFGIFRAMTGSQAALINGSQQLARALYAILEHDRRISVADLGVCVYHAAADPGLRFLALLKIDSSRVFRHIVRHEGGRVLVSFELEGNAFTSERLQKAAFIRPLEPRPGDYDLLLLDRQTGADQPGGIARFFAQTFLDTTAAFEPSRFADELYKGLAAGHNNIREHLTPDQNADLDIRIRQAVTSPRIDLDAWFGQLPIADEWKAELDRSVSQRVPVRQFELDPAYGEKLTEKVRFRGDGDLLVTLRANEFERIISKPVERVIEPGRRPFWRVTIETEKWEQV